MYLVTLSSLLKFLLGRTATVYGLFGKMELMLLLVPREKDDEDTEAGDLLASTAVLSVGELATILTVLEAASCLYCLSHVLRNVWVSINVRR